MDQLVSREPGLNSGLNSDSNSDTNSLLNRYEVARQALKLVLNVIELDSDELTARLFAFV